MTGKSLLENNSSVGTINIVARASARGKMIRKVLRHNKQVVERLNVFGVKTMKMF
jgi:hypothetical protein